MQIENFFNDLQISNSNETTTQSIILKLKKELNRSQIEAKNLKEKLNLIEIEFENYKNEESLKSADIQLFKQNSHK